MPERKSDKELLADLLARGYGEDERRKRRERAAAAQRKAAAPREKRSARGGSGLQLRRRGAAADEAEAGVRRMEDSLGPLSPALRRRIDRYAWRGGFLATGFAERLRSMLTVLAPTLEDWVARGLVRHLVGLPGGDPSDPVACSMLDGVQMLSAAARLLLGGERGGGERAGGIRRPDESRIGERVAAGMRAREPFVLLLLNRLAETDAMAARALEFARIAYRRGDRVRVRSLVRPIRYVYRLALATDKLESDVVARLASTAAEINRAFEVDAAGRRRVDHAATAVRVLVGRLRDYRHELFPLLLKCMGLFFAEEALWDEENFRLVCDFVDLKPGELLDYNSYVEGRVRNAARASTGQLAAARAAAEAAAAEAAGGLVAPQSAAEAEPAAEAAEAPAEEPAEGAQPFAARFGRVLQTLRELFPDSGVHRLQQYHFVLPYFDLRVFGKDLSFPAAVHLLPRNDPMSQIMVLHRILDNLISSVDPVALADAMSSTTGYREGLGDLVRRWKEVYTNLFDPYLKQIEDYARVTEVDRHGPTVRRMEDTVNRMRNQAIRHFGRVIAGAGRLDPAILPLYALAEQLAAECRQLGSLASRRLVAERDRQALAILQSMAERNVVDLEVNGYKPTIERLKRLLERRLGRPLDRPKMHLEFFEVLSDVAALYDWLLNDKDTFYRTPPDGPLVAGAEERRRWASIRDSAARGFEQPRPLPVSASAESWAQEFAPRFDALRRSGRLTFVLVEMIGRDVLEAEGESGALALAASSVPALAADAPVAAAAIGRDRLLLVTTRGARVPAGWVDRWRTQLGETLRKHPVFAEVLEQKRTPDLGSLLIAIAEVGDCGHPRDALARAEDVLAAARTGRGPIAVWYRGEAIGFDDYLARVVGSGA